MNRLGQLDDANLRAVECEVDGDGGAGSRWQASEAEVLSAILAVAFIETDGQLTWRAQPGQGKAAHVQVRKHRIQRNARNAWSGTEKKCNFCNKTTIHVRGLALWARKGAIAHFGRHFCAPVGPRQRPPQCETGGVVERVRTK